VKGLGWVGLQPPPKVMRRFHRLDAFAMPHITKLIFINVGAGMLPFTFIFTPTSKVRYRALSRLARHCLEYIWRIQIRESRKEEWLAKFVVTSETFDII
jgi:hypothetical protein